MVKVQEVPFRDIAPSETKQNCYINVNEFLPSLELAKSSLYGVDEMSGRGISPFVRVNLIV